MLELTVGEFVKRRRIELNLTQAELAEKVGIAQSMIAQYERYMKVPTIIVAVDIARVLGTTCEELVKGEQNERH